MTHCTVALHCHDLVHFCTCDHRCAILFNSLNADIWCSKSSVTRPNSLKARLTICGLPFMHMAISIYCNWHQCTVSCDGRPGSGLTSRWHHLQYYILKIAYPELHDIKYIKALNLVYAGPSRHAHIKGETCGSCANIQSQVTLLANASVCTLAWWMQTLAFARRVTWDWIFAQEPQDTRLSFFLQTDCTSLMDANTSICQEGDLRLNFCTRTARH